MRTAAACIAGATAMLLAATSAGAPMKKPPPCAPGENDVLCALQPLVRIVKPNNVRKVKAGSARRVNGGRTIRITKTGVANIFLRRKAECQDLSLTQAGTELRTRHPKTFLLQQRRGDALCTMADGRIVLVEAGKKLSSGTANLSNRRRQGSKFFASVEASVLQGGSASEYRMRFRPGKKFVVATHRGRLVVRLSNEDVFALPAGQELRVTLRPDGTVESAVSGTASFSPTEEALFGKQLQLPDLTVSIQGLSVSCPGGSGTCVTNVTYTVNNIGRKTSSALQISVEADPGVTATTSLGSVVPGKPRRLRTAVGPDGNCFDPNCTVQVTVDSSQSVPEIDEQNNVATDTAPG